MTVLAKVGTGFVHNTDLNPSEEYLATVPRLRTVLHDSVLLEKFEEYNRIANHAQQTFRRAGMISLCLACAALVGIALELLFSILQFHTWRLTPIILEFCAAVSIVLTLLPWNRRTRNSWLTARFMAEQIRQWHFQMLLDGNLISKAHVSADEFEAERKKRWTQFMERAPNAEGAMNSFVDSESFSLHHPYTPYPDASTLEESLRAYSDLRFQKQLHYFRLKREEFAERDDWSESVARWTIFSALFFALVHFILAALWWRAKTGESDSTVEGVFLVAAVLLVILSAIVRVHRSALALSPQRERYETKWVRLVAQRSAFETVPMAKDKLEIMKEVERIEIEELMEFIRQMRRATYLL